MDEKKYSGSLKSKLRSIEENGIQAETGHLKRNMCTQFADYNEFIREYVVNAYDAAASYCRIKVEERGGMLLVTVSDNGCGMNLNRLKDFLTVFRSRKDHPGLKPVGRHGIGKLSVAAIPGLCHFRVSTSTGIECYDFVTSSLLDDEPVIINKNSVVPSRGTSFEIGFKKDQTVKELTHKLFNILMTYVRYLPITIEFDVPDEAWPAKQRRKVLPRTDWAFSPELFSTNYNITLNSKLCEIVIGLGNGVHELFQNRVFISSNYNLFNYGLKNDIRVPNLLIRADSEAFELPFGRHCLCNEEVLSELSSIIRTRILPSYFKSLTALQEQEWKPNILAASEKIDELVIGLLFYSQAGEVWSDYPVFRTLEGSRVSMNELDQLVKTRNVLFIEAKNNEGIDYSKFDGAVLSAEQPEGAMKLVETVYKSILIDLSNQDSVIEIRPGEGSAITEAERIFENNLFFNPNNVSMNDFSGGPEKPGSERGFWPDYSEKEFIDSAGISEEARIAEKDLRDVTWKVNYLVERDGVTPCTRKKFIIRSGTIILNLFHTEIREFVDISVINPGLAAHWAIAMCLSDQNVLPHINPESREELLLLDAVSRLKGAGSTAVQDIQLQRHDRSLTDFIRDSLRNSLRNN